MNITIENKKQKALELMKTLDIYKPYVKGFEKDNNVYFFEDFGGFWAYQEPELMAKIKEFEEKHNCLVYAVTHEYLEFGECYGDHDSKPDDCVMGFVKKKWLPYANRKLKQLAA